MKKVFIDGSAGTTGLRIYERLGCRKDIELIALPEKMRKDIEARREAFNSADIVFLCLPDSAAKEAMDFIENPNTVVLDTSTVHRTAPGWIYGFPELSAEHRENIKKSKRIAVPGCHASGFIALVYPLIEAGLLDKNSELTCFSVTGYSGGGKKMIAEYELEDRSALLDAPRQYGILQNHKHLPEMSLICGISTKPCFSPIVAPFYSGMEVTVPLFASMLNGTVDDIIKVYSNKYTGGIVRYTSAADENGFLSAGCFSGKDTMEITVSGNNERILLVSRYDNLGKGASGAAIECMNIIMGAPDATGLEL